MTWSCIYIRNWYEVVSILYAIIVCIYIKNWYQVVYTLKVGMKLISSGIYIRSWYQVVYTLEVGMKLYIHKFIRNHHQYVKSD